MSEDQSAVLAFLSDPATHGGETPEHVETHGAHVFLAGDRALKIKRAVAYDYMDFSTLKQRRKMLEYAFPQATFAYACNAKESGDNVRQERHALQA